MARSLEGLLALNALFALVGSALLWGFRGFRDVGDIVSLGGVAYLLGVATTVVPVTVVLTLGGGASVGVVFSTALAVGAFGVVIGSVKQRGLPSRGRVWRPHAPADALTLVFAIVTVVVLFALYSEARTAPLTGWDAWAFWVPKAKIIYFFGGIDFPQFTALAGPSYPLFVPALDAIDFHFMGGPDTIVLAVQYWLLLVGFVGAMLGLLRSIAPAAITWLFAATAVAMPDLDGRLFDRTGTGRSTSSSVLLRWRLFAGFSPENAGLSWSTASWLPPPWRRNGEGQLLALCLVLGGVAALGRRRRAWVAVVLPAVAAYLVNVPWRIWWTSRRLASDTPAGGLLNGTLHLSRIPASFRLVLGLVFDFGRWHGIVPIALVAAVSLLARQRRQAAVFYIVAGVTSVIGWAWVNSVGPLPADHDRGGVEPDVAGGRLRRASLRLAGTAPGGAAPSGASGRRADRRAGRRRSRGIVVAAGDPSARGPGARELPSAR